MSLDNRTWDGKLKCYSEKWIEPFLGWLHEAANSTTNRNAFGSDPKNQIQLTNRNRMGWK
jgi:hypothetical protein